MRINIPGLENINIDDVLGRKPKPKKKTAPRSKRVPTKPKITKVTPKNKKKAIDRRIKLTPRQKSKIAAKPKRLSIPSGEIDISEIGSILPTSRPRPRPKPPVNKVIPKPKPRPTAPKVAVVRGMEDFARAPAVQSKPKPKPKPKPRPAIKSKPKYVPPSKKPSPVQRPIRPELGNEDLTKVAVEKTLGSIPGRGETGMINIPGVGPIQMPMPETPGSEPWGSEPWEVKLPEPTSGPYYPKDDDDFVWNQDDVINENPQIGTRPDGSPVFMLDQDASEYWKKSEETTERTTQGPIRQTETQTETETETETSPPPPPPVNPFKGFVPGNIIGQSFDPKDLSAHQKTVADARARMTPGANIQGGGYLNYDNPILGNKQTQFGGYGQPMPTKPLMNYAGLAAPNPPINIDDDDV